MYAFKEQLLDTVAFKLLHLAKRCELKFGALSIVHLWNLDHATSRQFLIDLAEGKF